MRRKTWLGACSVMQLIDSSVGSAIAGSLASLAHARATACTVSVLPAHEREAQRPPLMCALVFQVQKPTQVVPCAVGKHRLLLALESKAHRQATCAR